MNNYRKVILDASAFIALLEQMSGWEKVSQIISKSLMSSVNAIEVTRFLIDQRGYSRKEVQEIIEQLIGEVIDFTAEHAYLAAGLFSDNQELSLGDRACLALGHISGYPVYTADETWLKLRTSDININIVR